MADRYWVGGTATWDSTAGTKWSDTSGGAGGASLPTAADDVFFDANSGAVTVTPGSNTGHSTCRDLNFTGFTGSLVGSSTTYINVARAAIFAASMTTTWQGRLRINVAGCTLQTNGLVLNCALHVGPSSTSATLTFLDNVTMTGSFAEINIQRGSVNLNGMDVSTGRLNCGGALAGRSLQFNGTVLTLTRNDATNVISVSTGITLESTGVIKITGSGNHTVAGGTTGILLPTVWVAAPTGGSIEFADSVNINHLICDPVGYTLKFNFNSAHVINELDISGVPGTLNTLTSGGAGVTIITKNTEGVFSEDYLNVIGIHGNPDNTWYMGANSVDGGLNEQIYFTAAPGEPAPGKHRAMAVFA